MATVAVNTDDCGGIPVELRERAQWVTWRYIERDGKLTKVPCNPRTGEYASSTDPETWGTLDGALRAKIVHGHDGIGYVFAQDDPYTGVDLDHCRDASTGELSATARAIIDTFASYAELSPSGEGVHVFVRATMPPHSRHKHGGYEAYSQDRFFTVTGRHIEGTPATIEARQEELEAFTAHYLSKPKREPSRTAAPRSHGAHGGGMLSLDDDAILTTALHDTKFAALWYGDTGGYPSASEAVFALLRKLAFYTWDDGDRMDRLFRQSGQMSDKWDAPRGGSTLGDYQIQKILNDSTGDRASYLHLLPSAPEDAPDLEPEPATVQTLRARIAELEAELAAARARVAELVATVAQVEAERDGSHDANVRVSKQLDELREYKRSRDEAEERRQTINALPNKQLSTTDKLVLDCGIRNIRSAQSRGVTREDGGVQFPLGAPADELNISTDTASKSIHHLETLGYWRCDTPHEYVEKYDPKTGKMVGQWIKRLYLIPNEGYLDEPVLAVEAAVEAKLPERNHGGVRIRCEKCQSDDVVAQMVYICRCCKHEWRSEPRDANPPVHAEATNPEYFPYPQLAGTGISQNYMPQVAGTGNIQHSPATAATTTATAVTSSLCLQDRTEDTNPEYFPYPQDAGTGGYRQVSHQRSQQEYALYAWAKARGWVKLPYVGGAALGGDMATWGQSIREASDKQIALAYATISARVAAS